MAKDKAVNNMLKFRILFVLNKIDILLFIYKKTSNNSNTSEISLVTEIK